MPSPDEGLGVAPASVQARPRVITNIYWTLMVPLSNLYLVQRAGSPSQSESQLQDRVARQDPLLLLGLPFVCKNGWENCISALSGSSEN